MSKKIDQMRREIKANDDRRDAGLTTPEDVAREDDIPYGPDRKWQILDVYRPKSAENSPLPVIVNVHGGGWVYGTKETYQFYCMDLARRGFAVVNFTYRLAPEDPFPACVEDTCAVFKWVLQNAARYGFDKERVFAVGDSAGAHILALFCDLCTNPKCAEHYNFSPPKGFVPRAVALNCGAYQYRHCRVFPVPSADVERFVTGKFPPAFLMTSTGDFLKNAAIKMAGTLTRANVPCELHFYGTPENLLGHVFHCDIRLPDARTCNDDECAFFKRFK